MRTVWLWAGLWLCAGCGRAGLAQGESSGTLVRRVPGPGAAERYQTQAPPGVALIDDDVGTLAQAAVAASGLRPDPRLAALARWVGQWTEPDGAAPGQSALDEAAHQLGLVEPTPHILVIGSNDTPQAGARLAHDLSSLLSQRAYSHFGGAVVPRGELSVYVLCLAFRFVELQPVPRSLAAGQPIVLQGQLPAGYAQPAWAVTQPDGQVVRGEPGPGARFDYRLPTAARGVYRVELLAQSQLGMTVVANFPVFVGQAPPEQVALAAPRTATGQDAQSAAARLLESINSERAHSGLAPLTLDERLTRIALAHDADMLEHGFVGHTSKTTGDAADRVARAGIRSGLTLENIGRGYSPDEVHAGLMQSPGHRGNILSPLATHVGIGVSLQSEDGHVAYLVTELFTRVTPALQADARDQLLLAINQGRAGRRRSQLQENAALSAAASGAVKRCFEPDGDAAVMDALRSSLPAGSRVSVVLSVASSLEDLASVQALQEPAAREVGLSLAQGERADTPPNSLCALVLLAQ